MQRILIIGSGGAGKSTLARQLGEKLTLPVVHLDCLYWYGDWQHVEKEVFDEKLENAMSGERWIIDGNYNRTLPGRLARCDAVLYLDYPTAVCLLGVIRRILRYRGRTRPDMGGECRERLDWEFLCWVAGYRRKNRKKNLALLAESEAEIHIFRSRKECARFVQALA